MTKDKNPPDSSLDRRKQALRENLKRRKGAMRGFAAGDEGGASARPVPRQDTLKPQTRNNIAESESES